jgi:hypothetical protein
MTEEEALTQIDEIGQAFANDSNDGDGPVRYHGLATDYDEALNLVLEYEATLDDGSRHVFRWPLGKVEHYVEQ